MNARVSISPSAALSAAALDGLMPMHVLVGPTGHIEAIGPTLGRAMSGDQIVGRRLLEVFEVKRPKSPQDFTSFLAMAGRRLTLQLRSESKTIFKGVAVPRAAGGGAIVNLAFGIGIIDAVSRHRLTAADFAPTDLAVEMLYLIEAKSAAMEESRRLNQRLEGARSEAERQALTDALTGLANRRSTEEALTRLTSTRARFGLIHMDLDHFKQVNDTLGHAAGDAVLIAVAKALRSELREEDIAARIGGDEFILILGDMTDTDRLVSVARRIIARIEEPVPFGEDFCRVSASAGITVSTCYAQPDPERMLQDADAALYASKRAGRAQASVHRP